MGYSNYLYCFWALKTHIQKRKDNLNGKSCPSL
jgi:hypothetical protein